MLFQQSTNVCVISFDTVSVVAGNTEAVFGFRLEGTFFIQRGFGDAVYVVCRLRQNCDKKC
jgi:hypothetical protein